MPYQCSSFRDEKINIWFLQSFTSIYSYALYNIRASINTFPHQYGESQNYDTPVSCTDGVYNLVKNIRHNTCGKLNHKSSKICREASTVHLICKKGTLSPISQFFSLPFVDVGKADSLSWFYGGRGEYSLERPGDLPKVISLVSGRAGTRSLLFWIPFWSSFH